jgi:N-acetylglucosamine kinase-like BadF-type ATPase
MIAVVYSGSKNACWKLWQDKGKPTLETKTPSLNPSFIDAKQTLQILGKNITLIHNAENIKKIYVFSAGAASKEKQQRLADSLAVFFVNAKIKVQDDVYGAAIAACHDNTGIVGILGSGANCAFYNGKKPQTNAFGLGYILGDEGSANYFGKILLKNFLEGKLPQDLKAKIEEQYHIDRPTILERVYRKPQVQTYLASFLDFYIENRDHEFIRALVAQGFEKYIRTYIVPTIEKHPAQDVHFVGSVAGQFQDILRTTAEKHQIKIMSITAEPIHNILNYYTN